jgi:Uma2 family endonuclease
LEKFNLSTNPPQRSPQEELQCAYASQRIAQTYYLYPEFRLELVEGKFLVGGTLDGSRWLLKEVLVGWGADSAIAFASVEQWWEALRIAYQVPHQLSEDWLIWAESLPIGDTRYGWKVLGSQYGGEHRWMRDRLRHSLSNALSGSGLGHCFGPRYGMWIGDSIFTPDMLMLTDLQLAENCFYDRYMRGAANLVVEIVLPEHAKIDERVRLQFYQQHGVPHYWSINPVNQQVHLWLNTPEGYQIQSLDSDGSYRGVPGLTFTPNLLWADEKEFRSLPLGIPIVTSEMRRRRWYLGYEESESGESWDSVPFEPLVGLEPKSIQPEQFIAWCPECKLEGGDYFPLIGGSDRGTRDAIAMLLMSLGLVETVKLLPGYEWVRVLRRIELEQQGDRQKRQEWWKLAGAIAQQLHRDYQVGGVGVIGDLLQSAPLNYWSNVHLVLWNIPEESCYGEMQLPKNPHFQVTEVAGATPAEWQAINQNMSVLVGEWDAKERPDLHRRSRFYWLSETDSSP